MPYVIEINMVHGWEPFWLCPNGQPVRFDHFHDAQDELNAFISDCKDAVETGNLEDFEPEDYRIREDFTDRELLQLIAGLALWGEELKDNSYIRWAFHANSSTPLSAIKQELAEQHEYDLEEDVYQPSVDSQITELEQIIQRVRSHLNPNLGLEEV